MPHEFYSNNFYILELLMEYNEFIWDHYDILWLLNHIVDFNVDIFTFTSDIAKFIMHRQDNDQKFVKTL